MYDTKIIIPHISALPNKTDISERNEDDFSRNLEVAKEKYFLILL